MQIDEIVWTEDRVEHIARHGVAPREVEVVCFGRALVLRARSEGLNPVYHVLGETEAGRMLLCIVIRFPGAKGYPVTAREMTSKEQASLSGVETQMKLPTTDSIQELASFWDVHDVTEYDSELVEVPSPFLGGDADSVVAPLSASEDVEVRRIAASRGVDEEALLREWVKERLQRP